MESFVPSKQDGTTLSELMAYEVKINQDRT